MTNQQAIFEDWERKFVNAFKVISHCANGIAREKGFWETDKGDIHAICLMHSELSEAVEAIRNGTAKDKHCPEFSSVEVELADVILRIMNLSKERNWNVAGALVAKLRYNATRPYKHGRTS